MIWARQGAAGQTDGQAVGRDDGRAGGDNGSGRDSLPSEGAPEPGAKRAVAQKTSGPADRKRAGKPKLPGDPTRQGGQVVLGGAHERPGLTVAVPASPQDFRRQGRDPGYHIGRARQLPGPREVPGGGLHAEPLAADPKG